MGLSPSCVHWQTFMAVWWAQALCHPSGELQVEGAECETLSWGTCTPAQWLLTPPPEGWCLSCVSPQQVTGCRVSWAAGALGAGAAPRLPQVRTWVLLSPASLPSPPPAQCHAQRPGQAQGVARGASEFQFLPIRRCRRGQRAPGPPGAEAQGFALGGSDTHVCPSTRASAPRPSCLPQAGGDACGSRRDGWGAAAPCATGEGTLRERGACLLRGSVPQPPWAVRP